jgi:hypothetical protein
MGRDAQPLKLESIGAGSDHRQTRIDNQCEYKPGSLHGQPALSGQLSSGRQHHGIMAKSLCSGDLKNT